MRRVGCPGDGCAYGAPRDALCPILDACELSPESVTRPPHKLCLASRVPLLPHVLLYSSTGPLRVVGVCGGIARAVVARGRPRGAASRAYTPGPRSASPEEGEEEEEEEEEEGARGDGTMQGNSKRHRTCSSSAKALTSVSVARVVERHPGQGAAGVARMAGGRLDEVINAQFQRMCDTAPSDNGEGDDEDGDYY
jgi:hypothetical protein